MTTTIPWLDRDGEPFALKQEAAVERYYHDLLDGTVFRRHAISARSRHGYPPPTIRRAWSHVVATIGRMAGESDALAQVAAKILAHAPNLYGTDADVAAAVYGRAADAIAAGFDDVLARTGPDPVLEPSRRNSPWP